MRLAGPTSRSAPALFSQPSKAVASRPPEPESESASARFRGFFFTGCRGHPCRPPRGRLCIRVDTARSAPPQSAQFAMALAGFKIIDADGHVTEPASLYSTHIDPKFRAAADALLARVGTGNLGIVPALYPKWRTAERPLGEVDEVAGLGKL